MKNNGQENKHRNKRDIGRIAIRIIAAILAVLMVLAVAATLVSYI